MKLAVHKTYQFQPKAQKRMFARAVGAVGVRALARNIKSNSEYKGFAAEAIPVNLLPAPARTHGNRARQLAPRAGTAARRAQSTKCIGNARVPRVTGFFARSASAGTRNVRKLRRALCARIWYESVLAAALWEGETLAFFRRFCLGWRLCARGGERPRKRALSGATALGSGSPRERAPSGADALGSGRPRERKPSGADAPREWPPSGAGALGSGRSRERAPSGADAPARGLCPSVRVLP